MLTYGLALRETGSDIRDFEVVPQNVSAQQNRSCRDGRD
jgi:hypothetical protein